MITTNFITSLLHIRKNLIFINIILELLMQKEVDQVISLIFQDHLIIQLKLSIRELQHLVLQRIKEKKEKLEIYLAQQIIIFLAQ